MVMSLLILGCQSTQVVKLSYRKHYHTPKTIRYSNQEQRELYIQGYREGWLRFAKANRTIITASSITDETECVIGGEPDDRPYYRGITDGEKRARDLYNKLVKLTLTEQTKK